MDEQEKKYNSASEKNEEKTENSIKAGEMGKNEKVESGKKARKINIQFLVPLIIGICCFTLNYLISPFYFIQLLEWRTYDLRVALRNNKILSKFQAPTHKVNPDIAIILVDDATFDKIKVPKLFWTPFFAKVLDALFEGGAKTVSLDSQFGISTNKFLEEKILEVFRDVSKDQDLKIEESDIMPYLPKNDEKFFISLRRGKGKIIMMSLLKADLDYGIPYRPFANAVGCENLGLTNIETDKDGVVRRQFLLKTDKNGQTHYNFSLLTAMRFLDKEVIYKSKNSPFFCIDDIHNWNSFLNKIKDRKGPVEKRIWSLLDEQAQKVIMGWNPGETPDTRSKLHILDNLNNIILNSEFFTPGLVEGLNASGRLKNLVEKVNRKPEENDSGDPEEKKSLELNLEKTGKAKEVEFRELNRLTIEFTFPDSIARSSEQNDEAIYFGETRIPILENYEMVINYIAPAGGFSNRYSFGELVERARAGDREYFRKNFEGKAVLIGPGFSGSTDLAMTPYNIFKSPEMFGVEAHANVLNTLLNGDYVYKAKPRVNIIIILLLSIIIAFTCYYLKPAWSILTSVVILVVFVLISFWVFFRYNYLLEMAPPLDAIPITFLITYMVKYITADRKSRYIRRILGRYISEQVASEILKDPSMLALGGERKEVSILFCDINDFTPFCEKKPPEEIIEILNDYFTRMERVIFEDRGTLKQFVGDEIMVICGAPQPDPDHAYRIVKIALDMTAELERWRKDREQAGKESFDVKFGIHSGKVIAGNVGSPNRAEYTTIGDVVNTTSRIMGLTKKYKTRILMSDETYHRVKDRIKAERKGASRVKGREEEVVVYEVIGLVSSEGRNK